MVQNRVKDESIRLFMGVFLICLVGYLLYSGWAKAINALDNYEISIETYNDLAAICDAYPEFKEDVNKAFKNDGKITHKEYADLSEISQQIKHGAIIEGFIERIKE